MKKLQEVNTKDMKKIKRNYKNIDQFVLIVGGVPIKDEPGMYLINNERIDLTSSGIEHWQITKNILKQLCYK